jgi:hypothetical protein
MESKERLRIQLQRLRERRKERLMVKGEDGETPLPFVKNKVSNQKKEIKSRARISNKPKSKTRNKNRKPPQGRPKGSFRTVNSIFKPLEKWNNFLGGASPVFILGNGPSLAYQDLSLLDNCFTIGINRILYHYEPTVIFWQDISVSRDQKDLYLKSNSIKVFRQSCCAYPDERFLSFKFRSDSFNKQTFPEKPTAHLLYGTGNTINICSQFAASLNPSHIILLGVDCRYEGEKTNSYGVNKRHTKRTMLKCCEALRKIKNGCKIPIINCGWNQFWEQRELKEVLEELNFDRFNNEHFWERLKK